MFIFVCPVAVKAILTTLPPVCGLAERLQALYAGGVVDTDSKVFLESSGVAARAALSFPGIKCVVATGGVGGW